MSEQERLKILTMLDEKKISVSEAAQLLAVVEAPPETIAPPSEEPALGSLPELPPLTPKKKKKKTLTPTMTESGRYDIREMSIAGSHFYQTDISGSTFNNIDMSSSRYIGVTMTGVHLRDINLGYITVTNGRLGGVRFHRVTRNQTGKKPKQLKFDACDMTGSTISQCRLNGVKLVDCNVAGMKINGIPVQEMLDAYNSKK